MSGMTKPFMLCTVISLTLAFFFLNFSYQVCMAYFFKGEMRQYTCPLVCTGPSHTAYIGLYAACAEVDAGGSFIV